MMMPKLLILNVEKNYLRRTK